MASTHRYLPSPPSQVGESAGLRLLTLIESGSVPIEDYIPRATDYDHQRRITGVTSSRSHTKKHPKDHVARPGNAFLQFRSDFIRTEILPRDIERNNAVLSKITAAIWRKMPISRRTPWMLKAEREKEEHMLRYPDYQYGPSRSNPSTKKDKNRPNCSGTLLRAHKSKKVVRPLSPLIYPPLPMLPEANAAPVEPYPHNDVEPTSGQRQSSSYSLPRAPEATSVLPSCTNLFTIDASWNLHSNGQSHQQFRTDFSNVEPHLTAPFVVPSEDLNYTYDHSSSVSSTAASMEHVQHTSLVESNIAYYGFENSSSLQYMPYESPSTSSDASDYILPTPSHNCRLSFNPLSCGSSHSALPYWIRDPSLFWQSSIFADAATTLRTGDLYVQNFVSDSGAGPGTSSSGTTPAEKSTGVYILSKFQEDFSGKDMPE